MPKGKKYGGRTAGTPNKTTAEFRELLAAFTHEQLPEVQKAFKKLTPKTKVMAYIRLLKFQMPEYSSINYSLEQLSEGDLEKFYEYIKMRNQTSNETESRID